MEIPIDIVIAGGRTAKETIYENVCNINVMTLFYFFMIPLLIGLLLIIFIRYKDYFMINVLKIYAKRGFIRIYMIQENRRIKPKLIKLDKFNNFKIKNRTYSLEKMFDFLLGYDKFGFPTFLYDYQFILPLYITKQKITDTIKHQLGDYIDEKSKDKKGNINKNVKDDLISAISMKLDSSILNMVYTKKLISDLYSISGDVDFKKKLMIGLGIIALLIFLYYTGYLESILNMVGIEMPKSATATATAGTS